MTGRELLRFYAGLKRVPPARCDELLEEVGLAGAARQRLRTYSKGMRQRLGLAQALLGEPRLLCSSTSRPTASTRPCAATSTEAISGADGQGRHRRSCRPTCLTEIEARADVVAILRAGELVAFGTLDELRRRPRGLPVRLRLKVTPDARWAPSPRTGGRRLHPREGRGRQPWISSAIRPTRWR